jgi:hypothetical protein
LLDLEDGLYYKQAVAGGMHTVLIRSDGSAVTCGDDGNYDSCVIRSELQQGQTYTYDEPGRRREVLQVFSDGSTVRLMSVGGNEVSRIQTSTSCRLADLQAPFMRMLGSRFSRADIILPSGELLKQAMRRDRLANLRDISSKRRRLEENNDRAAQI